MSTFGKIIKLGWTATDVEPTGRGKLMFLEFESLPFVPKRMFIVDEVPEGTRRGNHAHYECQQILVCMKGRLEIQLDNGKEKATAILYSGDALFHDKLEWATLAYFDNAKLLSVCSSGYDPNDYITDYQKFMEIINES